MRAFILLCLLLGALLPAVRPTPSWLDGLDVRDPSAAGFADSLVENFACSGQCPHLVVRPKTNEEVAAAIRYAHEGGRQLVVRGGGHGYTCQSTAAGAVMVDLRRFKFIRMATHSEVRHDFICLEQTAGRQVDVLLFVVPQALAVEVGAGVVWAEVLAFLTRQPRDLQPLRVVHGQCTQVCLRARAASCLPLPWRAWRKRAQC